jgi:predicted nucleic acid-binding Zn finger protein
MLIDYILEISFCTCPSSGRESVLQPGHGMCCGIHCFEASEESEHGIRVEVQVHVKEVCLPCLT